MRTIDIVAVLRQRFPGILVPDGADVPLTINIDASKVRALLCLDALSVWLCCCTPGISGDVTLLVSVPAWNMMAFRCLTMGDADRRPCHPCRRLRGSWG